MEVGGRQGPVAAPSRPAPWSLSADQREALVDTWRAFSLSRVAVWLVGIAAVLAVGAHAQASPRLDSLWLTAPFDSQLANLLVAPGARFDASWYLEIAIHGDEVSGRAAFFPLYPGLVSVLGDAFGSPLVAGILLSCGCSLAGLYLLHRLTALDHGADAARATVWIVAWLPAALTLSAVYTEGLFLLLSVGSFYAARTGRWRLAALLALLASGTRSAGVLLLIPLLILYFFGPRADRPPDFAPRGVRPRYRLRRDALWLVSVPLGLLAYVGYLGVATGEPLSAFTSQSEWERVAAPLAGIALGLWHGAAALVELPAGGVEWHFGDANALLNLALAGSLVFGGWLLAQAARRLPAAYTAYAGASLALPLSVPMATTPLASLPRFQLVAFPLWIALALWARERNALRWILGVSGVLMAVATILFTSWVLAP